MSIRTFTNTGVMPSRRLLKLFDGNAIGTTNPNNLPGGPKLSDAMGRAGQDGIASFCPNGGAEQTFNVFAWNGYLHAIDKTTGWMAISNINSNFAQDAPMNAWVSYAISELCPFFIMAATSPVPEVLVSGTSAEDGPNDNTDRSIQA